MSGYVASYRESIRFFFNANEGLSTVILVCFQLFFFFFQAEDGIRDDLVTGVQTCALSDLRSRGSDMTEAVRFRETINSVSAGSRSRVASTKSVPSTFKTSPRQMEAVLSSAALDATSQRSTSLGSPLVTWNAVSSPSRQKRMSSLCLLMRRSRIVRSGSQPGRRGST